MAVTLYQYYVTSSLLNFFEVISDIHIEETIDIITVYHMPSMVQSEACEDKVGVTLRSVWSGLVPLLLELCQVRCSVVDKQRTGCGGLAPVTQCGTRWHNPSSGQRWPRAAMYNCQNQALGKVWVNAVCCGKFIPESINGKKTNRGF